jgi:urease accessory protein
LEVAKSALKEGIMRFVLSILVAISALPPTIAFAHTGYGDVSGFIHGFAHPITGIDHVLAMIAVGVLAAQLGGRTLWVVPLSFVLVMAVAGALAMAGMRLPWAEVGIALSVLLLGLAIALPHKLPASAAIAPIGLFGLFHGHVHGTEMPALAAALPYAAGFFGATVLLHTIGVCLGLLFGSEGSTLGHRVAQISSGAMALFGAAALASAV